MLGAPLDTVPRELRPGLHALRLDPQEAFRDTAARLLGRAKTLFDLLGVEQLDREELAALPGARHLALLDAVRTHARSGEWDAVVLAGPPVPELLAALALPEQLGRYLDRLLPDQRQAARALRPMLAGLAGVPMPADWLFEARTWASGELADVQGVLDAPTTTIRLAVEAPGGPQALAALRRARAGLALHERRVDAVVATGMLPDSQDPFLGRLHGAQQEALAQLRTEWDAPVVALPHPGREPEGLEQVPPLPELPPVPPLPERWVEDRLDVPPHVLVWHLPLPGAERGELDVVRRGDDLVLGVGSTAAR
ncbi:ArsA-related P-loop ATPase [Streptacidiphilus monticola]